MSHLLLPDPATPARTFSALAEAGALEAAEPVLIKVPDGCWVEMGGLAFLAAWGAALTERGGRVLLRGDDGYLGRMDLHAALGAEPPAMHRRDESGRFLPVRLVRRLEDIVPVVSAVTEIFSAQLADAGDLLPAMQWIVAEILENVFLHADTPHPAAVCAQHYPNAGRIDLAICDVGRGLRASLAATHPVYSDGHAIDLAVERGVSGSDEPGRGNGLAGTLEIARHNRAAATVWSGSALYIFRGGADKGFEEIPRVPGTGVALQLSTRQPVRLEDTWIAEMTGLNLLEERVTPGAVVIRVAEECPVHGARDGATAAAARVEALAGEGRAVRLDFTGVGIASTSFLTELLGRPAARLGPERFRERVEVAGMSELLRRLADVAIARRLRDAGLAG